MANQPDKRIVAVGASRRDDTHYTHYTYYTHYSWLSSLADVGTSFAGGLPSRNLSFQPVSG
jgi:hypothetical protein